MGGSRLRLELFLRSIAARPDLARSVKAVALDPFFTTTLDFFASRDAFEDCAHALGTSALDIWRQTEHAYRANPQTQHQGYEAFFVRDADPGNWAQRSSIPFLASQLLTMLVALSPNLSYLKVISGMDQLDLSRATSNAIGLTRLPLKTLDSTLRFESLLELSPDIGALVCRYALPRGSFPNVQSLVAIVRHDPSQGPLAVTNLLSACTGHVSNFSYRAANPTLTAVGIVRFLSTEKLHATLESIHIDCRWHNFTAQNRVMPNFRPFLNLRALLLSICLVHADIDSDSQTLASMLPASITSLTLVGNGVATSYSFLQDKYVRRLRGQLMGLAEAKAEGSGFEHLTLVRCDSSLVCSRYVRGRFKRVGVDLVYQEFPRPDFDFQDVYPQYMPIPDGLDQPLPGSDDDDL
ncbi:unnamed protein product [Clonostachys byssicola]|uniref:Uncharacterized protein n=1 Tax=Clonostachys byssicola TaxID=160290 RepID=A0A9N9Y1K7_9HYPO|nr:unnamed protein product [Clonostachys byssicola]